ncbi:MAG: AMP-binding protein [Oscillospiraceae bacterium]|nr:AMP-binding protein [Oscillospiraceae bacterium]
MKSPRIFTDLEPFSNLKELVNISAQRHGEANAFCFERKKELVNISYIKFKDNVEALSTYIYSLGFANSKLAVIGENSYEWIVSYLATVTSGNIIVPLDRDLSADVAATLLADSAAEVLFFSDSYSDMLEILQNKCKQIKHFIPFSSLTELMEKGRALILEGKRDAIDITIDDNSMSTLMYTSGTTGTLKGVMLSHKNLSSNTVSCRHYVKVRGHSMLVLPLHHSFGFTTCVLYYLYTGSTLCINSSLKRIKDDFLKFKPYNVFMVPLIVESVYKRIWTSAEESGKDKQLKSMIKLSNGFRKIGIDLRRVLFKSVIAQFGGNFEYIITGGAPIDDIYIKGLCDIGIETVNGYGITECSPVVSVNRLGNNRIGSAGEVYTCCQVKIIDADEDGFGEILVKGDNVMLGYYGNQQLTDETLIDGWFRTGDIGYLDNDNFIYITGRKKSMIVLSNGKNVYPEDIEVQMLREIPYITEVIVRQQDNQLIAEMYLESLANPDLSQENRQDILDDLAEDIRQLNAKLTSYKRISDIVIRETEFDKTTTKKIKR